MQYYFNLKRKYENNLNYCFAIYEVDRWANITLIDSNVTFRKSFKISSLAYKRKKLENLTDPSLVQHLTERIVRFINTHRSHYFVKQYLYPGLPVLWESSITIRYSRNTITVYEISKKIMNLSQSSRDTRFQQKFTQAICSNYDIAILLNVLPNRIVIENVNKKFQYILGLPFHEILGKPIETISVIDSIRSDILKCVNTQENINLVEKVAAKNKERYFEITLTPLVQVNLTQVLIYAQDITDSIHSHQQIEDLTEELDYCFQTSSDAFCVYLISDSHQITIERENFAYVKFREEFKRAGQLLTPKDVLEHLLNKPEPYVENLSFKKADGKICNYLLRILPIFKNDKITKIIMCCSLTWEAPPCKKTLIQQSSLTNREQEILKLLLDGFTNKYISLKLNISEGTVKKIIYNLYKKLNVSSRVEIIKLFLK